MASFGFFSKSGSGKRGGLTSASGDSSTASRADDRVSAAHEAALEVPIPQSRDWADLGDESDYDENLQDDVFLGKVEPPLSTQLEIKNTFYNFPGLMSSLTSEDGDQTNPWQSAPTVLVQTAWRTKFPGMEAAHNRGECKPCAYFLYKPDGCRNSDNCPYCHLCRKGEIKRRKRKKIKQLKAAAASSSVDSVDKVCIDDSD
mmetsp:Transcript_69473/g.165634  ORF Transcript_69473/g.165634 Transcript_69473/m.165634 type:complete len:201 (+) Transcript_69473:30-632(+)